MMRTAIGKETKCEQHAALSEVFVRLAVIGRKHGPKKLVVFSGGK